MKLEPQGVYIQLKDKDKEQAEGNKSQLGLENKGPATDSVGITPAAAPKDPWADCVASLRRGLSCCVWPLSKNPSKKSGGQGKGLDESLAPAPQPKTSV